jgi:hypothetical protein
MIAVSLLASIPSVTCSAVEADPNPLGPAHPVTREKIPINVFSVKSWYGLVLVGFVFCSQRMEERMREEQVRAKSK